MNITIIKRDGTRQAFEQDKIEAAIEKALREVSKECYGMRLAIPAIIAKAIHDELIANKISEISVEEIQDRIETSLMKLGECKVAKAFILYRDKATQRRENPWSDNDERQDLLLEKYLIKGENKKQFIDRISLGNNALRKIFINREGIWGGRNLFAIGREGNITGSNCYVAHDPQDSLEDIYRADFEIARTYSYGGGQGMNLSNLRPRNAMVNNASNTSPGIMIFAEKYSHTTLNTQQEKRRGALMLMLNDNHPDLLDFITAKLDVNKINGANISIAISDAFMLAVLENKDWTLRFETPHEVIEKTVNARDLMEVIAYANHTVGDPGVFFIDTVNTYHLLSEYEEVYFTATNPCFHPDTIIETVEGKKKIKDITKPIKV